MRIASLVFARALIPLAPASARGLVPVLFARVDRGHIGRGLLRDDHRYRLNRRLNCHLDRRHSDAAAKQSKRKALGNPGKDRREL
jgi:hypothetical protein